MPLTLEANRRLAGMWGGYDFQLIRDRHFITATELVERFLDQHEKYWPRSREPLDVELSREPQAVRRLIEDWARRKLERILAENSSETLRAHIMFKQLHYGSRYTIGFGSNGINWRKKTEVAEELAHYHPWSIAHATEHLGGRAAAHRHFRNIVQASGSPSELEFFDAWWDLTPDTDRPMLFPQVQGHTSGKFWQAISREEVIPVHFDFGLVNTVTREKLIVEIDSQRYHSADPRYQADRDRQNIAEREGWSVRRYTYRDVMQRVSYCFSNLLPHLFYDDRSLN